MAANQATPCLLLVRMNSVLSNTSFWNTPIWYNSWDVRNKTFKTSFYSEIIHNGLMYCYHTKVDDFLITVHPRMLDSTYTSKLATNKRVLLFKE